MTITVDFERFQYLNFETSFLKNWNFSSKAGVLFFSSEYYEWSRNVSIKNLYYRKSMLRQIEWRLQNGSISKKRLLPLSNKICWKFNLSIKIDLICKLPKYTYSCFLWALQFYLRVCFPCEYPQSRPKTNIVQKLTTKYNIFFLERVTFK